MTEALYDEAIKELARETQGCGRLAEPDRTARLDNPLCGDRIDIDLKLGAGGAVAELAHQTRGCLLCRASAAILARYAPGQTVDALASVEGQLAAMLADPSAPLPDWPELALFVPVRAHRSRHGCVLLPFRALGAALR